MGSYYIQWSNKLLFGDYLFMVVSVETNITLLSLPVKKSSLK